MKQALEALETLNSGDSYKTHNAATALRQAIAEAEKQEPVGYVSESGKGAYLLAGVVLEDDTPLYTTPPKHEWVGLTDDEIAQLMFKCDVIVTGPTQFDFAQAIEAKLKEKNA